MIKNFFTSLEENIIAFLLIFMTLIVFMDVVMRFGFGKGFLWTQELTLYCSAWFVLFGISYGLKVGAHIGVDAFIKLLPPLGQRILSGVALVMSIAYCGIFLYGSLVYLQKMYQLGMTMEDIKMPLWFVSVLPESLIKMWSIDQEDPLLLLWMSQSILIFGLLLFSFRLLLMLWNVIIGKAKGFNRINEAEESLKMARELSDSLATKGEETHA